MDKFSQYIFLIIVFIKVQDYFQLETISHVFNPALRRSKQVNL